VPLAIEPVWVNGQQGVYSPINGEFVPTTSPMYPYVCDLIRDNRQRNAWGGGWGGSSYNYHYYGSGYSGFAGGGGSSSSSVGSSRGGIGGMGAAHGSGGHGGGE